MSPKVAASRRIRVRDIVTDTASRAGECFGRMCPAMPMPRVVQGADGKRTRQVADPFYSRPEDLNLMKTAHAETNHLVAILCAIIQNPGQREESHLRKFRATALLRDFLDSFARNASLPGVEVLVVQGQALCLRQGRLIIAGSAFARSPRWQRVKTWWTQAFEGRLELPVKLVNSPVC